MENRYTRIHAAMVALAAKKQELNAYYAANHGYTIAEATAAVCSDEPMDALLDTLLAEFAEMPADDDVPMLKEKVMQYFKREMTIDEVLEHDFQQHADIIVVIAVVRWALSVLKYPYDHRHPKMVSITTKYREFVVGIDYTFGETA